MTAPAAGQPSAGAGHDLRTPVLGLVAWTAAVAGFLAPVVVPVLAGAGCVLVLRRRRQGRPVATGVVWLLVWTGLSCSTMVRAESVERSPVEALARQGAAVRARLVVTSDPVLRDGRFGRYVTLRARAVEVTGRGFRHRGRAAVLVIAEESWHRVELGAEVGTMGRLQRAKTRELVGVLTSRGPPEVVRGPGVPLRAAGALRRAIRDAVSRQPEAPRALVPALVDGDDGGLPEEVVTDFRISGLTHLLAVSGTNLTLVVGALLLLARWAGVRAHGLTVVGLLGVAGFVLLARTEPSVVRAAAMGSVALLGLGTNGRQRGARALGVAVLLLLVIDPWLALSTGFALSAAATAGILWLAPGWRDRLSRWLPRGVAEAVAVPLAAQLACTPIVAAISAQVSLVAVAANLLAAPAVGPATVLGLAGGVVGLVSEPVGRLVAAPAAWCARWIVAVAERCASLPTAAVGWSAGPVSIAALSLLCLAVALGLSWLLARRLATVSMSGVLVVALLVPLPTPGWPPPGWVMVACDVGQGDGLVLNAGPGTAVVVDAGPDPRAIDGCLRRLGVRRVPLVVLTHFHADHVDGLAGVLRGREVGAVEVTPLADPLSGVHLVEAVAAAAGVPVQRTAYSQTRRVGPLTWQVVAPSGDPPAASESPPNDSSVVLLVRTGGLRLLLMGDEEGPSQTRLQRETGGVPVDVLKVAHHGSARQDPDLVRATGARLAVISVGADNDYGHPAPSLLALLAESRMEVARTDRDGDVAVVSRDGLRVVRRGSDHLAQRG